MKATVLLAASMLAGCATMMGGPGPRGHACGTIDCVITVTVTGCNAISVDRDPVVYEVGQKGDLEWNLVAPANWTFVDAVEFKNPASNSEFQNKRHGPKKVKLNNRHTKRADHPYNVVVTPDGGTTRCVLDPTIMNK